MTPDQIPFTTAEIEAERAWIRFRRRDRIRRFARDAACVLFGAIPGFAAVVVVLVLR